VPYGLAGISSGASITKPGLSALLAGGSIYEQRLNFDYTGALIAKDIELAYEAPPRQRH
jgi:hypothetical protein